MSVSEKSKLEDVMEMWSKDSIIDSTEPGRALIEIPKLHAKYLNILIAHTAAAKMIGMDIAKRRQVLVDYLGGHLDPEDLEKHGFDAPWQKRTILKSEYDVEIDADDKLNKLITKKTNSDLIVDYCDRVLRELNSRTYQLRSFIDWEQFTRK